MYALFRFANNLRLKMTLPPPCRDYWSILEQEKSQSAKSKDWLWAPDPFESFKAHQEAQKEHARRAANVNAQSGSSSATGLGSQSSMTHPGYQNLPEAKMSTSLRVLVESTLRSHAHVLEDDNDSVENHFNDPVVSHLRGHLVGLGFRPGHVDSAISTVLSLNRRSKDSLSVSLASDALRETALEWLQVVVPEDDLPSAFLKTKPKDFTVRFSTHSNPDGLARSWAVEELNRLAGFPAEAIQQALEISQGHIGLAIDILLRRLVGWSVEEEAWGIEALLGNLDPHESDERRQLQTDEMQALQGIYANEFQATDSTEFELSIPSRSRLRLRVSFHSKSWYPSFSEAIVGFPTFFVCSTTLPAYIRLHLTALAVKHLRSPALEDVIVSSMGGVVAELVEYLSGVCESVISHPPEPLEVLRHLRPAPPPSSSLSNLSLVSMKPKTKSLRSGPIRSRTRISQSDIELQENFNRLKLQPSFVDHLKGRSKLPAWSLRAELTKAIGSNRVTIVAGETGSGKTTQGESILCKSYN